MHARRGPWYDATVSEDLEPTIVEPHTHIDGAVMISFGAVQTGRLGKVVHDDRRHRVALAEQVRGDLVTAPDDERDRDRLTHRAPEPQHRGADQTAAHAGEHRDAQHLPARRAHCERAVLVVLRDCREDVAAERACHHCSFRMSPIH